MAVLGKKFEKVVILLSTGRTGTKALAQYFDTCYEQVRALHEPHPSRHLRVASNRYLCKRLSKDDMVRILAKSRRRLFAALSEPIYIESNHFLHGFLEALDELFEAPKIIHIVRDPRTYVPSHLNHGTLRGLKGLAARYYPFWMIKPDHYETNPKKRWRQMSHPERMAWRWKTINAELNRGKSLFGSRYLRVRFEDTFAKNGSGLDRVTDWIGLPRNPRLLAEANRQKVNVSRYSYCPPWQQWNPALKQLVIAHCRDLMELYGYSTEI